MDLVESTLHGYETSTRHPWELARVRVAASLLRRLAGLPADGVVVDVGCGDTFVVEQLAARFPALRFWAIDPAFTPSLVARFAERLEGQRITLGRSLDEVSADRPVAAVLLMDVIEHVADDVALLRETRQQSWVDAQTRWLVTVPAVPALFSAHDRFLGHFRRYDRRMLHVSLTNAGLVPIELGEFFAGLLPLRWLQLWRERRQRVAVGAATGLAGWRGGAGLSRLLAGGLWLDAAVGLWCARVGIPWRGLSVYAVCRRSAS